MIGHVAAPRERVRLEAEDDGAVGFKASEHDGESDPGSPMTERMQESFAEAGRLARQEAQERYAAVAGAADRALRRQGRQQSLANRNIEEELAEREDRVADRVDAAEDRARAAEDRAKAAEDREQAARERAEDRELAAWQRAEDQATATNRFAWQIAVVVVGVLISAASVWIGLAKDSTVNVQPSPVNVPAPVVTVVEVPPQLPR